jgi:uncharacterized protein YkwD
MAQGTGAWWARQSMELVNRERARRRLPRLVEDRMLTQVAYNHCVDMVARGYYDHISPLGVDVAGRVAAAGYLATMTAENIARGQTTPGDVVAGWMASPGHRANILHPDLRAIGAGYAYSPRDDYHHYWTHVFATPDPSVGRDRSRFPSEVVTLVNQARRTAGSAALTRAAALDVLARTHLAALVRGDARGFRARAQSTLEAASQAAATRVGRAAAQVAAGSATPEAVVGEWLGGEGRGHLLDTMYTEGGAAYQCAPGDDFRHYWLLVLAGPR